MELSLLCLYAQILLFYAVDSFSCAQLIFLHVYMPSVLRADCRFERAMLWILCSYFIIMTFLHDLMQFLMQVPFYLGFLSLLTSYPFELNDALDVLQQLWLEHCIFFFYFSLYLLANTIILIPFVYQGKEVDINNLVIEIDQCFFLWIVYYLRIFTRYKSAMNLKIDIFLRKIILGLWYFDDPCLTGKHFNFLATSTTINSADILGRWLCGNVDSLRAFFIGLFHYSFLLEEHTLSY